MGPLKKIIVICLLLALTAPWVRSSAMVPFIHMPLWAFYSFIMTFVLAITSFILIERYWDESDATEGGPEGH